jgi:hypothetical protein
VITVILGCHSSEQEKVGHKAERRKAAEELDMVYYHMVVLRLVVHQGLAEEEVVRRLDIEQEDMVAEGAGRVDQEAAADIQPSERQPFCLQDPWV